MKAFFRILAWCLFVTIIVVGAVAGGGWWVYQEAERPGPLAEAKTLVIPAHTGAAGIGKLLSDAEVIRYPLLFEAVAQISGRGAMLHPGEFEFPAGTSLVGALDIIASGRTVRHRLTVPEGLTSPEIAALIKVAPALDGDTGTVPAEGDLFPDTYVYSWGEKRHDLLDRMRQEMARVLDREWTNRRPDLPLVGPRDALILASLVEKETPKEEERAHIAGVFMNRLRLGMPLQCDPTVIFAIAGGGKLDRPLTHADLSFNSPYNTYLYKGLPPGPIANPGKASLHAAVRPEHTDDFYFVADGSGGHIFAKTLAEQSQHVAQYRHGLAGEPEAAAAPAPVPANAAAEPAAIPQPPAGRPPAPAEKPAGKRPAPAEKAVTPLPAAAVVGHPAKPAKQAANRRCRPTAEHPCPR